MSEPAALVAAAAANNAHWCDIVCRSHGAATLFAADFWICTTEAPPLYPNLVTLGGAEPARTAAQLDAIEVLGSFDLPPHRAVKDSFRSLDLTSRGYEFLFEAVWLARDPGTRAPRSPDDVSIVTDAAGLAEWEEAWRRDDANEADTLPPRLFRDSLLSDPDVAFIALRREGRIVAGAAVNRAGGVAGLSNLFTGRERTEAVASPVVAAIAARFPGLPIVDYETEEPARALRGAGFRTIGSLAVWIAR